MKRSALTALVVACLIVTLLAPRTGKGSRPGKPGVRFAPVHIYLDSGNAPLAAYQFELVCSVPVRASQEGNPPKADHYEPAVKIVGVEGGQHPAFNNAPYYDPAALANNRIIIAAFSTGADLPKGRTRIATIHLQIPSDTEPEYELKLAVAADADGREFPAELTLETGEDQ
ncbi:MAG: hypothetical protein RBS72_06850 [Sedimentisphaerales bacterium]|jgi:hypothetical protein|nr:hypothetical protein [Sedimentisphaerales bacterium]HNY78004.1 hypothetical protein [Sedimentisphaerales bacterium]HOC63400.1 hypothetical protein [Sedimentisphaerales bacterium]HOH64070.1 hypothetical protein [Sedimentisphaerales bacterium]HPY49169.1 hypothetical protein [Sedimentisphaerales bacterium]